ncbi:hypothetical protein YC2023_078359 [Brassica napus]
MFIGDGKGKTVKNLVVKNFPSYASIRCNSSNLGGSTCLLQQFQENVEDVHDTSDSGFNGGIEKWTIDVNSESNPWRRTLGNCATSQRWHRLAFIS